MGTHKCATAWQNLGKSYLRLWNCSGQVLEKNGGGTKTTLFGHARPPQCHPFSLFRTRFSHLTCAYFREHEWEHVVTFQEIWPRVRRGGIRQRIFNLCARIY